MCTNTAVFFAYPQTCLPSAAEKNPIGMHFCAILKVSYATKTESQVMADGICPVPHTPFCPNSRNFPLPVTRPGSHTILLRWPSLCYSNSRKVCSARFMAKVGTKCIIIIISEACFGFNLYITLQVLDFQLSHIFLCRT